MIERISEYVKFLKVDCRRFYRNHPEVLEGLNEYSGFVKIATIDILNKQFDRDLIDGDFPDVCFEQDSDPKATIISSKNKWSHRFIIGYDSTPFGYLPRKVRIDPKYMVARATAYWDKVGWQGINSYMSKHKLSPDGMSKHLIEEAAVDLIISALLTFSLEGINPHDVDLHRKIKDLAYDYSSK